MSATTEHSTTATAIRPFRADVPEAELADLRRRLAATRWPESRRRSRSVTGCPAGSCRARPLLGHGLRLAHGPRPS